MSTKLHSMEFKYEGNPELEEYVQKQYNLIQKGEISELDFLRELAKLQQKEIWVLQYNLNIWHVRYYKLLGEKNELASQIEAKRR